MHVFGLWVEAQVPGLNPHKHGENMQSQHTYKKAPDPEKLLVTLTLGHTAAI